MQRSEANCAAVQCPNAKGRQAKRLGPPDIVIVCGEGFREAAIEHAQLTLHGSQAHMCHSVVHGHRSGGRVQAAVAKRHVARRLWLV